MSVTEKTASTPHVRLRVPRDVMIWGFYDNRGPLK